jgi:hypothetical protein
MFLFVRDCFTTSDGITYMVLYNVVDNPRRWEDLLEIRRTLFVVKAIVAFEIAAILLTIISATSKIK